jgi:hypothetical protein
VERYAVAGVAAEFGRALLDGGDVDAALEQLCTRAEELIPGSSARIGPDGELAITCNGGLSADQHELADALADLATVLLASHQAAVDAGERAGQLQRALESRVAIEQAKGMLAVELGTEVDSAFEVMRAYTRNHGLRLHAVAAAVVERRLPTSAFRLRDSAEAVE